jgi:hypothetical protein
MNGVRNHKPLVGINVTTMVKIGQYALIAQVAANPAIVRSGP